MNWLYVNILGGKSIKMNNVYYNTPQYGAVCTKCGCGGCQTVTQTKYKDGGYGVGSGICGYLILGPIGLLCGLCGRKSKFKSKTYWICPSCGKKFTL